MLTSRIRRMLAAYGAEGFQIEGTTAQTPADLARDIVMQSAFADSARAAQFVASGNVPDADLAVRYARLIGPKLTAYQQAAGAFQARQTDLLADLGRARFAQFGYNEPPDATFSLRMADGRVAGYPYNGTVAPAYTTFNGLYDRYAAFKLRTQGAGEWELPERWVNPPASFDRNTPMNFASTNDIIGGNSGSPVLNRNLEVVGLVFDGNVESLPSSFIYAPETYNRSVAVDVRGMLEALDDIYNVNRIVLELKNGTMVTTEAEATRALGEGRTAPPRRTAPVRRTPRPRGR